MVNELDNFYLLQEEPIRSCLMALRAMILKQDTEITADWKYRMPFFCYKGKMFCYVWVHKELKQPYIGFVEGKHLNHPGLLIEKRSRMKILLCDPEKDLPVKTIESMLQQSLDLYRKGIIKVKGT